MNPVEFAKKHKIVVGVSAIALVGIIGFAIFGGGGGGSSSGVTQLGPTPQEIDAQTQLGLAQIQATSAAQNVQAQLTGRLAEVNAQREVAVLELQNQNLQDQRAAEVALYTVGQQASVELARTAAEKETALQTLQTALAQAGLQAQTQQFIANTQLQAVQAQVSGDVATARYQADAAKYAAKKQGEASKFGSILGFAGSLIGLFCDERLKTDVRKLYTDEYGVTWYSYRYNAEAKRIMPSINTEERQVGVIAQELLRTPYKGAVSMHNGYYSVDYAMLPKMPARLSA